MTPNGPSGALGSRQTACCVPRSIGRRACLPLSSLKALLAKFPRIGNLLAVLWDDPNSTRRYLDDLLVDKRGNRQGFPLDILRELLALRAYYDELYPQRSPRPWEVMNNSE